MSIEKLLAGLSVVMLTSSAQAGVIYSLEDAGILSSQVTGATTIDFNDGTCGAYVGCSNAGLVTGSVAGQYASPHMITDGYMSVANGSGTLLLGDTYDYFGLYWGSVDTYNYLSFYLGDVLVDMFSGSDLAGLSANGKQTWWGSNRYVNFYFNDGDLFDRVVVRSDGYAFESDNHAYASTSLQRTALTVTVPEPGTLFLLGAGLLGIVVIQRRRGGALISGTRPRVARI